MNEQVKQKTANSTYLLSFQTRKDNLNVTVRNWCSTVDGRLTVCAVIQFVPRIWDVFCKTSGFHGDGCEECRLLGCGAV
jgi:hypothetical protein